VRATQDAKIVKKLYVDGKKVQFTKENNVISFDLIKAQKEIKIEI
jgi:hypothetical protein